MNEPALAKYPRSELCDVAVHFWTLPQLLSLKLRSGDCGGKASQASSAFSSWDIKQACYTVAYMHVQDQYPAGKWILFHAYYWARSRSMPLQNTVVFLSGRCVADPVQVTWNDPTVEYFHHQVLLEGFCTAAFTSSWSVAFRQVKALTLDSTMTIWPWILMLSSIIELFIYLQVVSLHLIWKWLRSHIYRWLQVGLHGVTRHY